MKKFLASIAILLGMYSFTYSQSSLFESDTDVLLYLSLQGSFTNASSGITLSFTDMASNLSTGRSQYYSPEVSVLSSTRAIVKYTSASNPGYTASFVVDSKKNILIDKGDNSVYSSDSPLSNQEVGENRNTSQQNRPMTRAELNSGIDQPSGGDKRKNEFYTDSKYIVGTYISKSLGMRILIEELPYDKRFSENERIGFYDGDRKYGLQIKVTHQNNNTIMILSGLMDNRMEFSDRENSYQIIFLPIPNKETITSRVNTIEVQGINSDWQTTHNFQRAQ
jgi:hypothetical protein